MGISAYLDEELNSEEQRRFERHKAACAVCSATLRGVQEVRLALCGLAVADESASFKFRLCACLQEETICQQQRWTSPLVLGLAVAAALAILLFPEPNKVDGLTAQLQGREQNVQLLNRLPLAYKEEPRDTWRQVFSKTSSSYSHAQVRMISY